MKLRNANSICKTKKDIVTLVKSIRKKSKEGRESVKKGQM